MPHAVANCETCLVLSCFHLVIARTRVFCSVSVRFFLSPFFWVYLFSLCQFCDGGGRVQRPFHGFCNDPKIISCGVEKIRNWVYPKNVSEKCVCLTQPVRNSSAREFREGAATNNNRRLTCTCPDNAGCNPHSPCHRFWQARQNLGSGWACHTPAFPFTLQPWESWPLDSHKASQAPGDTLNIWAQNSLWRKTPVSATVVTKISEKKKDHRGHAENQRKKRDDCGHPQEKQFVQSGF